MYLYRVHVQGIGRAVAIALSKAGAETFALSQTKENLDSLVKEVSTKNCNKSICSNNYGKKIYVVN